jgi:hypothetical protein
LLQNKEFPKVVESFWAAYFVEGWMSFVLKEKLKGLKSALKAWHKLEYGGIEARIEELVVEISELDAKGEVVGLSNSEILCQKEKFGNLWRFLKNREALTFQRSRSKWLKEEDSNTKFFHSCVKARTKANLISALKVDDVWIESPDLIKGGGLLLL